MRSVCVSLSLPPWTRSSRARTSAYSALHLSLASTTCSVDSGIYLSLSTFTTNNKVTPVTHHLFCLKMLQKYQQSLWLKLSNSTTVLRTMPPVKGLSCIAPLPKLIASQFQQGSWLWSQSILPDTERTVTRVWLSSGVPRPAARCRVHRPTANLLANPRHQPGQHICLSPSFDRN